MTTLREDPEDPRVKRKKALRMRELFMKIISEKKKSSPQDDDDEDDATNVPDQPEDEEAEDGDNIVSVGKSEVDLSPRLEPVNLDQEAKDIVSRAINNK